MAEWDIERVIREGGPNTGLAWLLVGFVLLVAVENVLSGELLWAGFAATVAVLALLPAARHRDPQVMLPWEVLVLAALPLLGRSFATVELTNDLATYFAVAAIALVIAVELHAFTPVRMSPGFAVLFVVIATMATAGVWAVVRWLADHYLGTTMLLVPGVPEAVVERELMLEFVYSTAAGALAGVTFELYFRRYTRLSRRLPEGVVGEPEEPAGASRAPPTQTESPGQGQDSGRDRTQSRDRAQDRDGGSA